MLVRRDAGRAAVLSRALRWEEVGAVVGKVGSMVRKD